MEKKQKTRKKKWIQSFIKLVSNPNCLRAMFVVYRTATSWRKLPGSYQMRKTFKSSSSRTSQDSEKTKNQHRNNLLQENLKFSTRSEFFRTSQLLFGFFLRVQEPTNNRRMVLLPRQEFCTTRGLWFES
ncbi:hypothetical protein Bpfe_026314 [Biomphalaria pfeifferi]|uniref:Uncharacterized protein n=1 Tax=Biomphalaria pfeifferi TaxID=112525 RepID=A0AAD8AXQ1_BIOPF|nr:hypothetical protein Bpfe_026314 [Biomphalaria pfeifferi]